MGASVTADIKFDNALTVGGVGPVRLATDAGHPVEAAVGVALSTPGTLGVGVALSTSSPLHAAVDSVGPVGPVTIAGIPNDFTFHLDVDKLPKILVGLDPITINPVDLNIRVKEIPSVRAHLPADFNLGISVLGWELLCFRLCGEAQIITEPYEPNPCEHCGQAQEPPPDTRRHQEAP